jgi:hypothetical protein
MCKKLLLFFAVAAFTACRPALKTSEMSTIDESTVETVVSNLAGKHGEAHADRIERGVRQVADLWRATDGEKDVFINFCQEHFISDPDELDLVFDRLANNYEYLYGYLNRISLELNRPIHEDVGPLHPLDRMFGAFSPGAHVQDDLYNIRIAFFIALNFPAYSLEEKNSNGGGWDDREWGFARLGDYYTSRVPPVLLQEYSKASSQAGMYISEYNIYAGKLLNDQGETLFPSDMKLLAHWNLRDELKSNYGQPRGLEKQELLYNVMLRIISQEIPSQVINNDRYNWNPLSNEVWVDGNRIASTPEGTVRYAHLKNIFNALKNMDPYYPEANTYIKRSFDRGMEIPLEEVESLSGNMLPLHCLHASPD